MAFYILVTSHLRVTTHTGHTPDTDARTAVHSTVEPPAGVGAGCVNGLWVWRERLYTYRKLFPLTYGELFHNLLFTYINYRRTRTKVCE